MFNMIVSGGTEKNPLDDAAKSVNREYEDNSDFYKKRYSESELACQQLIIDGYGVLDYWVLVPSDENF